MSATYELIVEAMRARRQIVCLYQGRRREICPTILGTTNGEEKLLAYQFGGESSQRLTPDKAWRCFSVAGMSEVMLREGPWFAGDRHSASQTCVETVHYDVNPHSPYSPLHRL